ncbi:MAG: family 20 glycosylhydrolase [Oscillospiraceae bacterium]|nr:family 20 glycosylhydrolase [Oscillospiraceae bacterium]
MYTTEDIKVLIQPVPQQVTALSGEGLKLASTSKFCVTAPAAEKGPVKTAAEDIKAFLTAKCGEDCFAADGIPVTLELGTAPAGVKNEKEAYRIRVDAEGVTITGFGDSGLFYGVGSFKQMCKWDNRGACIPAVEILDWPDNALRGYKQECRYGSNVMERQGWLDMIDDLAAKKMNYVCVGLYGCWELQYDGRVAESLYLPLKDYPQLQTPMTIKYYSPTEGKWINCETLPPIFRDDFFGEIVRYAKDRGVDVVPGFNSFGHNTLFPRMLPEVAPKNEDGTSNPNGFCTANPETYKLLFSAYDQIIDEYLTPNGITAFSIHLDEVWDQYGVDVNDPYTLKRAWCQCPECRGKERAEIFTEHAIKLIKYLKEKGMKSIFMAHDMVSGKQSKLGNISELFRSRIKEEGLEDVLVFGWWWYEDVKELVDFACHPDDVGLRSVINPWNGYYIWSLLTNPLRNVQIMAEMNHNSKCGEGMQLYALWDRSYDRVHDCFADYGWNFEGTGSVNDVTERYVARHFAPLQDKVLRAFRLVDWITESRAPYSDPEKPSQGVLSHRRTLQGISYYSSCYFNVKEPYPRHFPGSPMTRLVLPKRWDHERLFYTASSMAKEAQAIFEEAANTAGCDREMALRMAYECCNYQVLVEDWIAFLQIYDLTHGGDQKKIAPIARARQAARLELMAMCEQVKEKFALEGATMRNHSIFMQTFADIAEYIENTDQPALDLLDITAITSPELRNLR